MLDFPSAPTVGQKYPQPPLTGVPVYTWDGEKWTTIGGSIVTATPATALPLMNKNPAVVGVATKYAREDHVHPIDTSRAPIDGLAYNGMQINGSFLVNQTFGPGVNHVFAVGDYQNIRFADGWWGLKSGLGSFTVQVVASIFPGYVYHTKVTCTAVQSSGYMVFDNMIEGWRFASVEWGSPEAQPVSFGFLVKSSVGGSMLVRVLNSDISAQAAVWVDVAANTLQWVTGTFAPVTTGVWQSTTGLGARFRVSAADGSSINIGQAVGATFEFTGVILVPGTEVPAAPRAPFVQRSHDRELALCQRYLEYGVEPMLFMSEISSVGITYAYGSIPLAVVKRATPSIAMSNWMYYRNGGPVPFTPIVNGVWTHSFQFMAQAVLAPWQGWGGNGTWSADAGL